MSPEVEARLVELTRARGRLLAPALFATMPFFILADEYLGYATPGFPYLYAWCVVAALGVLTYLFVQRHISDRWVHAAFAALPLCTTSSTLVTLAHTPSTGPVLLVVIQLASTGIMLARRWTLATIVTITFAAIPLLFSVPGLPSTMAIGAVVTAAAFGIMMHVLVAGATVRAATLQLAEAQTARALSAKLAETEALQAQLLHAQRMEAVGTLAAGMAHDMNNVLGAISNLGELVLENARSDQRGDLAQIVTHAGRGAELTRGLLAFSRRGQYRKRPIHVERVFADLLPLLRRTLPKSIELRDRIDIDGACIEADQVQLAQVITNLALNAADASDGRGVIEILATQSTGHVRIEVRDRGHGMDAETQLRAFEPFFTTKPLGKGTGLGLAIVWGIVHAHDGTIRIDSTMGQGTTFVIELPITTMIPTEESARMLVPIETVKRSMVLVVDDERAVRETTKRLLARMGLDVLVAENGEEALRVFRAHPDQIRLVVLDMGMPVMGGAETFRHLREQSEVPVVIATGYADDEQASELVAAGAELIEKPFTSAQLREQVARLVELVPYAS